MSKTIALTISAKFEISPTGWFFKDLSPQPWLLVALILRASGLALVPTLIGGPPNKWHPNLGLKISHPPICYQNLGSSVIASTYRDKSMKLKKVNKLGQVFRIHQIQVLPQLGPRKKDFKKSRIRERWFEPSSSQYD